MNGDDYLSSIVGIGSNRELYFHSYRPGNLGGLDIWVVSLPCPIDLPGELSAPGSATPLLAIKDLMDNTKIKLITGNSICVNGYNVYENDLGIYTSTNQLSCHLIGVPSGPRIEFSVIPTKPSQYFIVTGSNSLGEGSAGSIPSPQSCGSF